MLLSAGLWRGRGSYLLDGTSRSIPVECEIRVVEDATGLTITGDFTAKGDDERDLSIRVASNDVGTYSIDGDVARLGLSGVAKLDSAPNLGLLWNEAATLHVTFALFDVSGGFGFRGFARDGDATITWEIAFSLKQNVVGGDNVVSLSQRRRR
jgi:hypothetical protein